MEPPQQQVHRGGGQLAASTAAQVHNIHLQHQPSAAAALEIRALQRGEPVAASSLSAAKVHSIHQQHQAAPAALEIRAIQRGEPSPGSSQAQVHSIHQQRQPGAAIDMRAVQSQLQQQLQAQQLQQHLQLQQGGGAAAGRQEVSGVDMDNKNHSMNLIKI